MPILKSLLATSLFTLILVGCATPALHAPSDGWAFDGRLSVRQGEQRLAGLARWQHAGQRDEVHLRTPLGQTVARLVREPSGVTLETPDAAPYTAPDAETLTREYLGLPLPLSGLVWWVRGEADPARPHTAETRDGTLIQLKQDGWVIDYRARFDDGLPQKLDAERDGLKLRLVIDAWVTPDADVPPP